MDPAFCPFCLIAADRSKAEMIYEDHDTIAFLPLQLQTYGHTIVAPKVHVGAIWDLDSELLAHVMQVARMAARYRTTIGATGVNLLHASGRDAQQSVPHFHVHPLPRFPKDGVDAWPSLTVAHVNRVELGQRLRGQR